MIFILITIFTHFKCRASGDKWKISIGISTESELIWPDLYFKRSPLKLKNSTAGCWILKFGTLNSNFDWFCRVPSGVSNKYFVHNTPLIFWEKYLVSRLKSGLEQILLPKLTYWNKTCNIGIDMPAEVHSNLQHTKFLEVEVTKLNRRKFERIFWSLFVLSILVKFGTIKILEVSIGLPQSSWFPASLYGVSLSWNIRKDVVY